MRDDDRRLGSFLIAAAGFVLVRAARCSEQKPEAGGAFADRARRQLREAAEKAAAKAKEEAAKLNVQRERVGDGAHDPGAVIIVPHPGEDIKTARYAVSIAEDTANGTFLRGSLFRAIYVKDAPAWTLHERTDNFRVLAVIHGHFSEGWRPGEGPAIAVTITHSHSDGYFPFADSLYADQLPLDRFAEMLQAAFQSPHNYGRKTPIVVVDNREAHRAHHQELALSESKEVVRIRNWRGDRLPPLSTDSGVEKEAQNMAERLQTDNMVISFGEPGLATRYDRSTSTLYDEASGLGLTIRNAGDKDYYYSLGIVRRQEEIVAQLALHTFDCWRPGYGPSKLVNLNRAYRSIVLDGRDVRKEVCGREMPFEPLAAMLNEHPALFWAGENPHMGHAVLIDTRADPIKYYYG